MGQKASAIKSRLQDRPIVVIVGAGYAGVTVAKKLDDQFNVILFDRKDYMFHNVGALRASVNPEFTKNIVIPYDHLLKYGVHVHAEVTKIDEKSITVHGLDEEVKFDYLIIATGSNYAFPAKIASSNASDVLKHFEESGKAIKEANDILIIGGGPVGIELIGEICEKYPEKKITLVQANKKILAGPISDALRESLLDRIKKNYKNVTIKLGEKVILDEEMTKTSRLRFYSGKKEVKTEQGSVINCDLIFFCGGAFINSKSYENSDFFKNKLADRKRIVVNSKLQVEGSENIFAIGDCAFAGSPMAFIAGLEADVCAHNIIKHYNHQKNAMKDFAPPAPAMFVPLGTHQGASQLPTKNGYVVGATVTSKIKGETLFVGKYWKDLGFKGVPDQLVIPNKNNVIQEAVKDVKEDDKNEKEDLDEKKEEKGQKDVVFENVEVEDKYRRFTLLMEQTNKMTNKEVQKLFEGLDVNQPKEDDKYT